VLGCAVYRLPPLQTPRYNKPPQYCRVTTHVSRQETGSSDPVAGDWSRRYSKLHFGRVRARGLVQTNGTVKQNTNRTSHTTGLVHLGVSGGRPPNSDVVDGGDEMQVTGNQELQLLLQCTCGSVLGWIALLSDTAVLEFQ
jgi:hypothetical protein